MLIKTVKRQGEKIIELDKNIELIKKDNIEIQKKMLDDFIMTINEIQDVQEIKATEEEKDKMRNSIIDNKRTKCLEKLIELSDTYHSKR